LRAQVKFHKLAAMLAIERHRKLLKLLQKQGSIRTAEVARALGVTEETVRRDFEKLESDGALARSHGGAVRVEAQRREFSVRERVAQRAAEKERIARAALRHIQPGQTIFLDASTTVQQLARSLPDQPLTVLTNSLQIAIQLATNASMRVVILGGELLPSSLSSAGWAAEQTLELYRIDAAFVSCRGIDPARGLSEATEAQARLKHRALERAESVYLLADASKAGVASSYFFAPCSMIDTWIVDAAPARAFKSALVGVRIEIATP
jgi:DeoR/GlpR family transcriptional regulator of sugar metabolism